MVQFLFAREPGRAEVQKSQEGHSRHIKAENEGMNDTGEGWGFFSVSLTPQTNNLPGLVQANQCVDCGNNGVKPLLEILKEVEFGREASR